MREILFRGKRQDNGEWVNGVFIPDCLESMKGQDCHWGFIKTYRLEGEYENIKTETVEVDRETVGQFTGLTDKNGKKIFEGDIGSCITLDTNTERLAVIGFGHFIDENNGDEYLGFYIEFDGCKATITQLEMEEVKDRFEVIGNIHDNPELLKEFIGAK